MRHLILGGARSGKSRYAEAAALASGLAVTVVATAQALDEEMALRIAQHQADRPCDWQTVETPITLSTTLTELAHPQRCLVVDCLTLWLTNCLLAEEGTWLAQKAALLRILPLLPGQLIFVANEVGLGLVPEQPLGRLFRDEAGRLNQAIAALSESVTLVTAGLPLALKRRGNATPLTSFDFS
jgi:adenosylcobinamide kinase/adenosylcobinamide-phosphate guanylyltransferase